jgi:alkylhydroperoxidase family enzyme
MRSGTRRGCGSTATSLSSSACEFHSSTTAPTASTCTTTRRARRASPGRKIDTLTAWWETEVHSEADQAALRYAEVLTRAADTDRHAAFQRFHDALAENFSPEEILEIVGVVVNMNVWTRIKLAEGAMPRVSPEA